MTNNDNNRHLHRQMSYVAIFHIEADLPDSILLVAFKSFQIALFSKVLIEEKMTLNRTT